MHLVQTTGKTWYKVISWWSVLYVGETGVPEENHRPVASHWQTLSHNVVLSTPRHERDSNWLVFSANFSSISTISWCQSFEVCSWGIQYGSYFIVKMFFFKRQKMPRREKKIVRALIVSNVAFCIIFHKIYFSIFNT